METVAMRNLPSNGLRIGRRPVTFHLGERHSGEHFTKISNKNENNESEELMLNQSAMQSCWKNVHGEVYTFEKENKMDDNFHENLHKSTSTTMPMNAHAPLTSTKSLPNVKTKSDKTIDENKNMTRSASVKKSILRSRKNNQDHNEKMKSKTKTPVYRQSSQPIRKVHSALENGRKRHSMPLPVLRKKEMISKYIFSEAWPSMVGGNEKVPELFKCIRGATQRDLFDEMDHREAEPAKACYEVMYVGRAKVKGKKLLSSHIDDLVLRLEAKEREGQGLSSIHQVTDRRRHKSDTSVKSLPSLFDDNHVKENELQKLSQQVLFRGTELHNESPTGSSDDIVNKQFGDHSDGRTSSVEHLSSDGGQSSSENIVEGLNLSNSGDHLKDMFTALNSHPEGQHTELQGHSQGQGVNPKISTNRTMLFRIGQLEISLISLDKKQTIIERKFKNISSVSQGTIKNDVFGYISREPGSQLVCHLLRCCTSSLVDEIMVALRTSFQSAFEQTKIQTQQICVHCPLHQYHKLCQDINGLCPETAYNLLCKRIQQLPEKEASDLYHSLQNENPQCHEESVEVLMIGLRKICEHKQREHTHISDTNKSAQKSDFYLIDMKGRHNNNKSKFEFIRNRAKKTLTNSFESLITNVHHKTEEVKDKFRHRSGTNESEGGSFSRSVDLSTPEDSPAPSPAMHVKDHVHFDFPSPPPSPTSSPRPRSSTVGSAPDAETIRSVTARQEERLKAEQKELEKRRASESPMKHMFILANASSPRRRSSGNSSSGHSSDDGSHLHPGEQFISPGRRGSWRKEIFDRVVTPARHPQTPTLEEKEEEGCDTCGTGKKSRDELRALWKKAILETLLLIRMEKENLDLRARQDEMHLKRQKLDYVEITPCLKDVTKSWDDMLATQNREQVKFDSDQLLNCVKQGIPQAKRGDIWWFLVEQHCLKYPSVEEKTPKVDYTELLKQLTTHQHAILIDLGRTFPGHPYFSMQLGNGQLALFNLLKAYSLMDQDVGYCQGLSFVAGILLMHMEEVLAFEAWKHVMYNLGLRKQYRPNMIALQIQLYQLTRLLHDDYRDLYDHFEKHEIAPTLYAAPWFLTLFASQFPLGFVGRVFDLIFIQGIDVIFKVALVLLGNHKELILQCDSFETIVEFIKTTLPEMGMIQMERVINQVFDMDICKQLQSYEVEYHVLKEEMMYNAADTYPDDDRADKLEQMNINLKQQNMELIEKLQNAHSHERSLEIMIHNFQTQENKLKSHIRTLELERSALLNAVSKLKQCIPESDQLSLEINLPPLTPSMPASPVHYGSIVGEDGMVRGDNGQVGVSSASSETSKSSRKQPEES